MASNYELKKQRARLASRQASEDAREIGPLPAVVDPARKAAAIASFKTFCETYFKDVFYLKWSAIHLQVIAKIERVINNGEIYALAMPRGSGKTTLFQIAVLWAAITGRAELVVLIAANATRAAQLLEDIKIWLETNDLLNDDFPEICYPIRRLERVALRARGQLLNGEPTRIGWKAAELVLPMVEGSKASGACIRTAGTKGSDIRGVAYTRADGRKVRPSLAFVDDPQTRETAQSATQCDNIESVLKADVLGMAGPGRRCACCVAMTVICSNDVAERLLDKSANPEFRGERYKLLTSMPKNLDLWEEYRQIRDNELQNDGNGAKATAFYKQHRIAMDEGAVSSWPERYNADEISAIQCAMNLKFRDEAAFLSEYQNEPPEIDTRIDVITPDVVLDAGRQRGVIPSEAHYLTAFIDVHKNLLYWALCAWTDKFSGAVVDYGTYPPQKRARFTLNDARPTLADAIPGAGLEGQIYGGLQALTAQLFDVGYKRDDDSIIELDRVLIDAGWGASTDTIYHFIKESGKRASILPSHGRYIGAKSRPFGEYSIKRGDRVGLHWRIPSESTRNSLRRVLIDTNYWKSFVYARLTTAPGDPGRLTINGAARENALFLDHLTAEKRTPVEAQGRRVDEWQALPDRDNHWLDCLVGCAVGASIQGAKLDASPIFGDKPKRERVSFAAMQQRARQHARQRY